MLKILFCFFILIMDLVQIFYTGIVGMVWEDFTLN